MDWLAHLVAPLNHVLFVVGSDHVSVAELAGFVTGAWCVWLTVKADIWNFPVGLANDAFFLVLFLAAGLYADSGLQVVYLVLGAVGWWQWLHGGRNRTRPGGRACERNRVDGARGFRRRCHVRLDRAARRGPRCRPVLGTALTTALSLAAQWLLNTRSSRTGISGSPPMSSTFRCT